jgi:hypothetical protein
MIINNFMDYHNLVAAKLNLDLDYKTILDEILSCEFAYVYTPPKDVVINSALENKVFYVADKEFYKNSDFIDSSNPNTLNNIVTKSIRGPNLFYLRLSRNIVGTNENYAKSKLRNIDEFDWRTDLLDKIPYTKKVIENIFTKIGIVRVFVTKDSFIPAHRDYIDIEDVYHFYNPNHYSTDFKKVLGLSLIPCTGDTPLKIYSPYEKTVIDVPGNAMLFNDSLFHGVPMTNGYRVDIRIFGELDYTQFDNKLDMNHIHYLRHS